ncbi:MAG TPA: type II toxin-antitoxin system PemK/MazF family toxin [Sphaerochaeta sp.]|nr:type II toxin-antitoxin system PemK/MazF family toxin [Sphaerochaeta sp.]HOQ93651.1 type II toxin-antitoxin system PemK/MazF family toxin [Sphaerochaeta sp.]HPK46457.1 type II toxin-antitoxin system PemK/MazF family toxin [Sphaerochaeta sp.]
MVSLSSSGYHGEEPGGFRPALVLTPRSYNQYGLALMCPITSKEKERVNPVVVEHFKDKILLLLGAWQI